MTTVPTVKIKRKGAVFTAPLLSAEIEYRAWTDDGKLRSAFAAVSVTTARLWGFAYIRLVLEMPHERVFK